MLRDFTWTEKYEEAMSDEEPLYVRINDAIPNVTDSDPRRNISS